MGVPMYCIGLALNFVLHFGLQKQKMWPMCAERWMDYAVTIMPHTGSFNSVSRFVRIAISVNSIQVSMTGASGSSFIRLSCTEKFWPMTSAMDAIPRNAPA
jgi:hypothetical protein